MYSPSLKFKEGFMPNHSKLSFGFGHPKTYTTPLGQAKNITSSSFDGIVCATTYSSTNGGNVACRGTNINNSNNHNKGNSNKD